MDGWREALRDAGAPEPEALAGDWSAASGYELGQRLARDESVTAVLCANDPMALGLLRALSEHGRRVPEDVSVIGFDDVPEAAYFPPPLTTMRQDFGELGRRALDTLVGLIYGRDDAGRRPGRPAPGRPVEHRRTGRLTPGGRNQHRAGTGQGRTGQR